jgi:hypothetical protein
LFLPMIMVLGFSFGIKGFRTLAEPF